jgi:hypothetical protein
MRDSKTAETVINNTEIYRGRELYRATAGRKWARLGLVRIDSTVANHRIVQIRRDKKITDTQKLHVIGHPSGLPTIFAGGASVRDNLPVIFYSKSLHLRRHFGITGF